VTNIGDYAFANCTNLSFIAIPLGVQTIGLQVFQDCKGPIYCAVPSKPDGCLDAEWKWSTGYTGEIFWGSLAPVIYTVTFNGNGGTVFPTGVAKAQNEAIGDLPTPTRTGYTFDSWYTAASGGTQITAATKVTASVTYYAHWTTSATPAPSTPIAQHAGANRFETATKASQKAYPTPSAVNSVIISFSDNFPDALAASYLAGVADAPILLTSTTTLHQATLAELNRLTSLMRLWEGPLWVTEAASLS
jgi:uncharacterized repeat protein (TIGR02543 family)